MFNGEDNNNNFNLFSQSNSNTVRIQNNTGENNCYVNVLIHSAYYFEDFLNSILNCDLSKSQHSMNLLTEFQKVLQQYTKLRFDPGDYNIMLDPTTFKIQLAKLFQNSNKYQLNNQEDPIELLIFLFNAFHSYQINPINFFEARIQDQLCEPKCFVHNLFHLKLIETTKCAQCETINQINYDNNYFIYELYVIDVFRVVKMQKINLNEINGNLLSYSKISSRQSDVHCDKHASEIMNKRLICEWSSKYLLINLVWNSMTPKVEIIGMVFDMIALDILNEDLFEVTEAAKAKRYELSGIITYWNAHYVCAFNDNGICLLYDDKKIDQFDSWETLWQYLVRNHYQPICLFYTDKTINAREEKSENIIVPIPQDQLLPSDLMSPEIQLATKVETPIKPHPDIERKEKVKKIVPEFFKPYHVVEEDKKKNVLKKKLVLTMKDETNDNGNIIDGNERGNDKKANDNLKEEQKQLIYIQTYNSNNINYKADKSVTRDNKFIKCPLCHYEKNNFDRMKCKQCNREFQ